jgi:hypothetical protein
MIECAFQGIGYAGTHDEKVDRYSAQGGEIAGGQNRIAARQTAR